MRKEDQFNYICFPAIQYHHLLSQKLSNPNLNIYT